MCLCQLGYQSHTLREGVEPSTLGFGNRCSIQSSFRNIPPADRRAVGWPGLLASRALTVNSCEQPVPPGSITWSKQDSNLHQSASEADASASWATGPSALA